MTHSLSSKQIYHFLYFCSICNLTAEYWKSLPRKFCDVCKCWFADNKASIQFHERGKRHQENAQKRIKDIQKRGIKEFKKQKELEDEMAKIEKAALAAYQKDLAGDNNSNSSAMKFPSNNYLEPSAKAVKSSLETVQKKISENLSKVKSEKMSPPEAPAKVWYEAETEEGYKYYWNTEDSESQWEPPAEGYVSLEEQKDQTDSETISEKLPKSGENSFKPKEDEDSSESKDGDSSKSKDEDSSDSKDENSSESKDENSSESKDENSSEPKYKSKKNPIPSSIGPQPKVDPYGQWVTVEKEEPVQYDLQLPEQSEGVVQVVIPLHNDGPSLKFKEKVIGQLADSEPGEVTFKKRKFGGAFKRNARQRTVDDD